MPLKKLLQDILKLKQADVQILYCHFRKPYRCYRLSPHLLHRVLSFQRFWGFIWCHCYSWFELCKLLSQQPRRQPLCSWPRPGYQCANQAAPAPTLSSWGSGLYQAHLDQTAEGQASKLEEYEVHCGQGQGAWFKILSAFKWFRTCKERHF